VAWINSACGTFFTEVRRLVDDRGIEFTVKYVKTCRNCITRALSGEPVQEVDGIKLDKNGIPSAFSEIYYASLGSKDRIRVLMSLLVSLRSITLPPKLVTDTITDPWEGIDNISDHELRRALYNLKVYKTLKIFSKNKVSTDIQQFHVSTKKGTKGPAMIGAMKELTLLTPQLIDDIILLGGRRLGSYIRSQLSAKSFFDLLLGPWMRVFNVKANKDSTSLRRISYFSDKEGKTRVVAILDYWSQTSLRPLHKMLNNILRTIPRDCTFNQGAFTEFVHEDNGPNLFHSLDLTAATDRMPIALQKRVIAQIIGTEKSEAWSRILVDYPFQVTTLDENSKRVTREVKYNTGQPMGAYSSWPAMALTHHVLVQVSALRCGYIGYFDKYFLLGDDLVIARNDVAKAYLDLIASLGMPYSPEKTHTGKTVFEFAKRWFQDGQEITGYPIGGVLTTYNRYSLFASFMKQNELKGWCLPNECHSSLIRSIFSIMKEGHYIINKVESHIKLYMVFISLLEYKIDPNRDQVYEDIFLYLSQIADPSPLLATFKSRKEAFFWLLLAARRKLMISDRIQLREAFDENRLRMEGFLSGFRRTRYGGLRRPTIKHEDTMRSVLMGQPITQLLEHKLIDLELMIKNKAILDPKLLLPASMLIDGLGKYKIGKEIFSMQTSMSVTLAESAIVKAMIAACKEGVKPDPSIAKIIEISRSRDPHVEYMMSGIPILALAPFVAKFSKWIAPNIYKAIYSPGGIRALLIHRLKGAIGVTVFTGLLTWGVGVSATVSCILAIHSALSALFILNDVVPGVSEPISSVIGKYLFRLTELLLVAYSLSIWTNFEAFSIACEVIQSSYQLGVTSLGGTILDFITLCNNCLYKTATGVVEADYVELLRKVPSDWKGIKELVSETHSIGLGAFIFYLLLKYLFG
jgi:hypothetical protein